MAVFLDLKPAPQFDRSLVDYMVYNFREIQTALLHVQSLIDYKYNWGQGPWDVDIIMNFPFACNITLYCECVWYSTVVGMSGLFCYWDGVGLPMALDRYCNEANSYMKTSCTQVINNVSKGGHVFGLKMTHPYMGRHANDRIRWAYTAYAI